MARRRKGRPINGVILLDKPTGISSNDALQKVKRIYFAEKAGHTGALDPLATGMLPICLGEATKFSQFLLDSDKRYRVIAKLGERTDTSDSDGEVVETRPIDVNLEKLEACIDTFRGESDQVPSMFSALKYQGKPLYEYARKGIEVPRESRKITVYEIVLHRFEGDEVEMEVHCSKGTYIRTIVDDLGEMLGCGAHVTMLRRTGVAKYPYEKMVTLEQLNELLEQAHRDEVAPKELLDPLLLPMDTAVEDLPEVNLNAELTNLVQHGMPVQVLGAPEGTPIRMTSGEDKLFIGVAEVNDDGKVAPKRLVVFRDEE
ncbi:MULTISPECIES: tRNA pseudouridine(55) synthase TruB [Vibrio]|jgi:tRNA pseudouridine55 synthase|uniref:tRNA pseudouridine synthase B n=1 Tax=Vibrio campbellii TaxID=680 RepID=A0ABY5I9G6_9VIBR|nr:MULTISPECIES: tRNA pseudouridine(55) synthase TruB [Vibrio]EDL67616.1 tRNA pseudouridine synthase B [Vibrio campbellii HY01]MED5505322.1 tRNA pseudouridine(55) synthase TruB [Pseudomonadota bacterium]APX05233.1 tRNA pseudouridine(55) synthase TruB [Vibrio campbellii]ARR05394.1 tRNA pseudouridine synthase B [Vibrio campbellii]MDK9773046.1 tRNA pseudouridine(55) synthase TruB [Vibrio sp. B181a]|tara:strand:- start:170 stop:1114 length:945 start_codon:yes stop_codon:yes gene_type:complete